MAKQKSCVNKSEEIRQLFKSNPKIPVTDVVSTLAGKGIKVAPSMVYFVKGHMKGRRGRKKKAHQMVARVAATTSNGDPVATIMKVKGWADQVGGLRKLKALVDALCE
jgi:hypothetical protein